MASSLQPEQIQLKILCLHGYRQNVNIFRQKTGGLRRALKNYAKFYFINAPHSVPHADNVAAAAGTEDENDATSPIENENGADSRVLGDSDKCGWWLFIKDQTTGSVVCEGLEKSINIVEKTFQEEGPFDGILAFSQGATLAGILSVHQHEMAKKLSFKFVIIIAGAHSLWEPLSKYREKIITIPSLHIIGETDQVIQKERSEAFLKCFSNARYQTHPGGHYVPANASLKNVYIDFLQEQTKTLYDAE